MHVWVCTQKVYLFYKDQERLNVFHAIQGGIMFSQTFHREEKNTPQSNLAYLNAESWIALDVGKLDVVVRNSQKID